MPDDFDPRQLLEELRQIPTPKAPDPFEALMARTVAEARSLRESLLPNIHVAAPEVVVQSVPAAEVRVDVPDQSAALVALTKMIEQLASAFASKEFQVTVNVPKQPVALTMEMPAEHPEPPRKITVERDRNGLIVSAKVEGVGG